VTDDPTRDALILIANPHASHGRGATAARDALATLRELGVAADLHETSGPGHAVELARGAAAAGAATLVAVGGDGTLHEVLNGALAGRRDEPPRLGLVPVGGGNDYARMLGIPADAPAAAARVLAAGRTRTVDAGRLEGCAAGVVHFLNNVGLAYMGAANAARERTRFLPSKASYVAAGLLAFATLEAQELSVAVDGVTTRGLFQIVHVGIGRYCGAGVCLTPEAALDDGRFEVFLLAERPRWRTALDWGRIAAGRQREDAAILRGRRVRVMGPRDLVLHADGEIHRAPRGVLTATLLPGAVRVIAP